MFHLSISHPTGNTDLPSFHRPELLEILDELQLVYDCWQVLRENKTKYLPKEVKEPDPAYINRVKRSVYSSFFKDSIRSFAGKLSRFNLIDTPVSIDQNIDDVDRLGTDLHLFLSEADSLVMRDGGCAILTEMPPTDLESAGESVSSLGQERQAGRRPHWVLIDRGSILNWQTEIYDGVERLMQVTIRELKQEPDGAFGVKCVPHYRVLRPGSYEVWKVESQMPGQISDTSRTDTYAPELVDFGPVLGAGQRPLDYIPIKWYGSTSSSFGAGDIPLLSLATLSLKHFQCSSDLTELLHKTALPVPVRKGSMAVSPGEESPALIIGPNSALDIPIDGDFFFAEPSGGSLNCHQKEIEHLEELMDRQSMQFLQGQYVQRSATEAMMRGAAIQANLLNIAQQKISMYQSIVEHWCSFTSETVRPTTQMEMDPSILDKPMSPDEVGRVLDMVGSKVLSKETALSEMIKGQVLKTVNDPQAELKRLEVEIEEERQLALEEEERQVAIEASKAEHESALRVKETDAATKVMQANKPEKLRSETPARESNAASKKAK